MKPIKIQISREMREFNEAVEHADFLLDYRFDQEPADVLIAKLRRERFYPAAVAALEKAMAGMAIKR